MWVDVREKREKRAALTVWGCLLSLKRLVSVLHWDVRAICEWMWERRERREQHWLYEAGLLSLKHLVSVLHWDVRAICEWMWERRERREQHWLYEAGLLSLKRLVSVLHWDVRAICEWMWERRERREQHWLYEAGLLFSNVLCLFSTEMLEQYVSGCEREEREESSTDCMRLLSLFSLTSTHIVSNISVENRHKTFEREKASLIQSVLLSSLSSVSLHWDVRAICEWMWERRERREQHWLYEAAFSLSNSCVCHIHSHISSNISVDVTEQGVWEREGQPHYSQCCLLFSNSSVCSPLRC